jgi:hypothetical protein
VDVTHFYEASIFDFDTYLLPDSKRHRTRVRGIYTLTSSPRPFEQMEEDFDYGALLDEATMHVPLETDEQLRAAMAVLATPSMLGSAVTLGIQQRGEGLATLDPQAVDLASRALEAPLIPVEASPLRARTLVEISSLASTGGLYLFHEAPLIAFVGTVFGLVALRPLRTVSGALWAGARPELEEFGGDAAAVFLNFLRGRLGVPRRRQRSP